MKRELSLEERAILSKAGRIGALERAGRADYNGRAATEKARKAAWQRYLDEAGGDPEKAARLRKAALLRGRMKSKAA